MSDGGWWNGMPPCAVIPHPSSRHPSSFIPLSRDEPAPEFHERDGRRAQLADRELEEPLEAFDERGKLRLRSIVRTPANDRFARVEQQVEGGLAGARELTREFSHVVERRVRGPHPSHAREAELPEHAFGRVRTRRAR